MPPQSVTDVFLPLLGDRCRVPLKAVACIGEIITLEARLRDYGGGLMNGPTLEDLDMVFEAYEQIILDAEVGTVAFLQIGDELAFIELLAGVRSSLAALSR